MKKVYPDLDCTITNYNSLSRNSCVFEKECDQVSWQKAPFTIQLDDSSSTPLDIDVRKLFVSSAELDPKLENKYCHFTVTNDAPDYKWVLGAIFLRQYYVVFDMTPELEQGLSYF